MSINLKISDQIIKFPIKYIKYSTLLQNLYNENDNDNNDNENEVFDIFYEKATCQMFNDFIKFFNEFELDIERLKDNAEDNTYEDLDFVFYIYKHISHDDLKTINLDAFNYGKHKSIRNFIKVLRDLPKNVLFDYFLTAFYINSDLLCRAIAIELSYYFNPSMNNVDLLDPIVEELSKHNLADINLYHQLI